MNNYLSNLTLASLVLFFSSCTRNDLPEVITSNITYNNSSLQMSGEVLSTGGSKTSRGFVWAKHPNPTEADNFITDSQFGKGAYSLTTTNVVPSSTYYVRAFAENTNGRAYGDIESFQIPSNLLIAQEFLIDTAIVCYRGFYPNSVKSALNFKDEQNVNAIRVVLHNNSETREILVKKGFTWNDFSVDGQYQNWFQPSVQAEVNGTYTFKLNLEIGPDFNSSWYMLNNELSITLLNYDDIVNLTGVSLLDTTGYKFNMHDINKMDNTNYSFKIDFIDSTEKLLIDFSNSIIDSTLDYIEIAHSLTGGQWGTISGNSRYEIDSTGQMFEVENGSRIPEWQVSSSSLGSNKYQILWENLVSTGSYKANFNVTVHLCVGQGSGGSHTFD